MQLVIMSAGIGSRFGGLKQLEPIDDAGNFIINYSIFQANHAGFDEIILVINPADKSEFDKKIKKKVGAKIRYAFQTSNLKNSPKTRKKPWGTAHALVCAKRYITQNFAVINADDFYGQNAFLTASKMLKNFAKLDCGLVAYKLEKTLNQNATYKRGICQTKSNILTNICECEVRQTGSKFFAKNLLDATEVSVDKNTKTSMNFWCFTPKIFDVLLPKFFEKYNQILTQNPLDGEVFLPVLISELTHQNILSPKIKITSSECFGITHKSDLEFVKLKIKKLSQKH